MGYFLHLLDFCAVANLSLNKRKPTTLGVVFRFTPKLKDTEVSHRPSILPPLGPTPTRVIQLLLLQLINFFDTLLLQKIYSNLTWCCTSRCVVTPTHHQSLTWSKSPPLKHLCLPSTPHLQFPEMGGGLFHFALLCFVCFYCSYGFAFFRSIQSGNHKLSRFPVMVPSLRMLYISLLHASFLLLFCICFCS